MSYLFNYKRPKEDRYLTELSKGRERKIYLALKNSELCKMFTLYSRLLCTYTVHTPYQQVALYSPLLLVQI